MAGQIMSTHSTLSPSGFKANAICAGRRARNDGVIQHRISEDDAERGTTAHELLDGWFHGKIAFGLESFIGSNGYVIDSENIAYVREAYDEVVDKISNISDLWFQSEIKVDPGLTYKGKSVSWGTVDIGFLDIVNGHLYIYDYKNGIGIMIDVTNNYQLMLYAIGLILLLRGRYKITHVTLGILQPRGYHFNGPFRYQVLRVDTLMSMLPKFQAIVDASYDPNAVCTADEEACRWCGIKARCPEATEKGMAALPALPGPASECTAEEIVAATLVSPAMLTDAQVLKLMDASGYIASLLKANKEYVTERLNTAKGFPGYKLVAGRSSQQWATDKEEETKTALYNMDFNENQIMVHKLKSPAQMAKVAKPLLNKNNMADFKGLIVKTSGSPAAVPESDKRPSIRPNAKEILKPVK
jgi:hypothetical protein